MSIVGKPFGTFHRPAYGGCHCACHREEHCVHVAPCCYPRDDDINSAEMFRWKELIKSGTAMSFDFDKPTPVLFALHDWEVDVIEDTIFHFKAPNQYELCSAFIRIQEFYESPYKSIRNNYFTLEEFMDLYAKDHNNVFSYFSDWSGFNIPGNVIEKFIETFEKDRFSNLRGFTEKEDNLLLFREKFEFLSHENYYFIGTYEGESQSIDHELAHALYYVSSYDYRIEMEEISETIPMNVKEIMKTALRKMGYCEEVLNDEIQAYLATSSYSYLKKHFNLVKEEILPYVKAHKKIFKAYTKDMKREVLCSKQS